MAKPFGKADFVLIADAIKDAIEEIGNSTEVHTALDSLVSDAEKSPLVKNKGDDLHNIRRMINCIKRVAKNELIDAFKNKLKYTSDSFDPGKFHDLFLN